MIIETSDYMIISADVPWKQGTYPDWAGIESFGYHPGQRQGYGVEPHYHDQGEFWLFLSGKGEGWLQEKRFEITPNTVVYTPMGVVHRFQMFRDFETVAAAGYPEGQKRIGEGHLWVDKFGPPVPAAPGFTVAGASNQGPFPNRGPRCPLSELRLVEFKAGEKANKASLDRNEYWVVVEGILYLAVERINFQLQRGDVAILKAGTSRSIQSQKGTKVAFARE